MFANTYSEDNCYLKPGVLIQFFQALIKITQHILFSVEFFLHHLPSIRALFSLKYFTIPVSVVKGAVIQLN